MNSNVNQRLSVAVFMLAYNHGKYIRQAIESVIAQKTNFPYKLFIGEDFSTDNTREICLELKNKYPEKIELLLTDKNLGPWRNGARVYDACIAYGKYTAICDGDDYWTDENKLQKQVDFLEANPDFNICCHRAKVLNEKSKTLRTPKIFTYDIFTQEDVANHNFIQTLTEVFRNSAWKGLTEGYYKSISGDYYINMMLSETGKIKYFPDVMAVYRQHDSGSWQSLSQLKGFENTLSVLNYYLITDISESVKKNLRKNIVRHRLSMYHFLKKNGKQVEARECLMNVFSNEFLDAWNYELENFISNSEKKERKLGSLILKPYIAFRNLLSKISFFIHRLKYD